MVSLKELFEEMADDMGMCLDKYCNDWDNPYIIGDTILAFKIFSHGAKAQELLFDSKVKSLLSKKGEIIGKLHFTESKLREALEEKEELKKEYDTMDHNIGWLNKMYGALEKENEEIKQKLKESSANKNVSQVVVDKKDLTTWYYNESAGLWQEDPDNFLHEVEFGEVLTVQRLQNFSLPDVYVARPYSEVEGEADHYREYTDKEEAVKVAKHCEEMLRGKEND